MFLQKEKNFGHAICVIQEINLDDHSDHFWPCNTLISKKLSNVNFILCVFPHEVQRTYKTHPSSPGFYYKSSSIDSTKALEIKYLFTSNFCE